MPIGVLTNCAAVLAGGALGAGLGKLLPEDLKDNLPTLFGLCSIGIGINSVIKVSGMTAVVLALLVGFTIGHLLHLEYWTAKFFLKLVKMLHLGGDDIDMDFYVTAVALFCCSGFGWYSTLTEGITGDPSLLMSKAVLDGFTAMIFASSLGKSVCAIPLPQCVILLCVFGAGKLAGWCADPHHVCGPLGLWRHPDHGGRLPCGQDQVPAAGRPDAGTDIGYAVQLAVEHPDGLKTASKNASCTARGVFAC